MRVVIQCAGAKRADAGTFCTTDGRQLVFIADPASAPCRAGILYAHPDDPSDLPDQTWRHRVVEANRRSFENPEMLLPAGRLYAPKAYAMLEHFLGADRLFILSAGWGLVRSDFLLPAYDITFSGSAERHKRRCRAQHFHDFNELKGQLGDDTIFLGGKDYLPLFMMLSEDTAGRRLVFFNSAVPPKAPGCVVQAFPTSQRTNWHYRCADALASGALVPDFVQH